MSLSSEDLLSFLTSTFDLEEEDEIGSDTLLFSTGILDSFDLVEIVSYLEARAGVRVGPMDVNLQNLDSVDRMLAFVAQKS